VNLSPLALGALRREIVWLPKAIAKEAQTSNVARTDRTTERPLPPSRIYLLTRQRLKSRRESFTRLSAPARMLPLLSSTYFLLL